LPRVSLQVGRPQAGSTAIDALSLLTPKEAACLQLVARHLSSKEIAAELGIAKTSVDTYCNRARAKLGVSDRFAAARLVAEATAETSRASILDGVAATAAEPAGEVAARAPGRRRWAMILGLAIAAGLGLGALLLGFDALEDMKPHSRKALRPAPSLPFANHAG
jgi:DNA-binding CsgD family transcriptional regulator